MITVAIDPGAKGGWASFEGLEATGCGKLHIGKGCDWYDTMLLAQILEYAHVIVIEEPFTFVPMGQSVKSLVKANRVFGQLAGIAQSYSPDVHVVRPKAWTSKLKVGSDKKLHVTKARELFPQFAANELKFWNSDGVADALLIGQYWLNSK